MYIELDGRDAADKKKTDGRDAIRKYTHVKGSPSLSVLMSLLLY